MAKIVFTSAPLELDDLAPVLAGERVELELRADVRRRIAAGRAVVERVLRSGEVVYGVDTGFGNFKNVRIAPADVRALQLNLIRSHACGVGEPLPAPIVRATMVLRVRTLATGRAGVRVELAEKLVELLHADVVPIVPAQGSVGASGDLAPLAHLALAVVGEGECEYRGRRMATSRALKLARVRPLTLEAKEGIALINGTQVTTALTLAALLRAENLARHADLVCALTVDAVKGSSKAFDARIHAARPHPGQVASAANVRKLLAGSAIVKSHADCGRVQDPYSLRCAPQVHGACRDALAEARRVLAIEVDSATDNPLVFAEDDELISGGNFHAQPIAASADRIAASIADLASISERRLENLVSGRHGLPEFLTPKPGLCSGFMIPQVVAASLVSECKALSFPAAVDSIPTSANQEDHVSMGPIAARKALQVVECAEKVVAIELLAALQALDFEEEHATTRSLTAVRRFVRRRVARLVDDRVMAGELELAAQLVRDGVLLDVAAKAGVAVR